MELKRPGDPSGVGAQYLTSERQAFQADRLPRAPITKGMRAKTLCEVRELSPNQRISWHAHPTPIKMGTHADIMIELAPEGEGHTRLTQTILMHQPELLFAFFHRFKGVTPEKAYAQWQASLNNVKLILEEPAPSAAHSADPATLEQDLETATAAPDRN
jgi:hypothetical protein